LGVSPRSINEIVLGRRAITPEMSLKLGKFFKQSPQFWFNLQTSCDFRRLMKQANRITAKVKGDFTKLAACGSKRRAPKMSASEGRALDWSKAQKVVFPDLNASTETISLRRPAPSSRR
jgi:hypothetical protein